MLTRCYNNWETRLNAMKRLSIGIAYYTERRENHGTMILDGVCYSALLQFCGVMLSRMIEPYL